MQMRSRLVRSSERCGSQLATKERPFLAFQHWVYQPPSLDKLKCTKGNAKLFLITPFMPLVTSIFCFLPLIRTANFFSDFFVSVLWHEWWRSVHITFYRNFVNGSPLGEMLPISYALSGIHKKVLPILQLKKWQKVMTKVTHSHGVANCHSLGTQRWLLQDISLWRMFLGSTGLSLTTIPLCLY